MKLHIHLAWTLSTTHYSVLSPEAIRRFALDGAPLKELEYPAMWAEPHPPREDLTLQLAFLARPRVWVSET